jgi:hypothetical protein
MFTLSAAQSAGSWDNIDDGYYVAELNEITEPKEQKQTYDGKEKVFMQSRFIWVICDGGEFNAEKITLFVNVDGRGEKSKLWEVITALGLDPSMVYQPDDLLNKKAKLNIQVKEGPDGTRRSKIIGLKRVSGASSRTAPAPQKANLF